VKNLFFIFMLIIPLNALAAPQTSYVNIPADTLKKWVTIGASFDFLLIDVLDIGEMVGSTKDSVIATDGCRPYKLPWNPGDSSSVFKKAMNMLPKDTAIIVYCHSGNRSKQAAQALITAGFSKVYSLNGGISGWTGPVKSVSFIKPTSELPAPSMLKKTAVRNHGAGNAGQPIHSQGMNSNDFVPGVSLMAKHPVRIYNVQGKSVEEKQNLNSGRNDNIMDRLSAGHYIIKSDSRVNVMHVGIVR